jgi:hypothetical protein
MFGFKLNLANCQPFCFSEIMFSTFVIKFLKKTTWPTKSIATVILSLFSQHLPPYANSMASRVFYHLLGNLDQISFAVQLLL